MRQLRLLRQQELQRRQEKEQEQEQRRKSLREELQRDGDPTARDPRSSGAQSVSVGAAQEEEQERALLLDLQAREEREERENMSTLSSDRHKWWDLARCSLFPLPGFDVSTDLDPQPSEARLQRQVRRMYPRPWPMSPCPRVPVAHGPWPSHDDDMII